MTRKLIIAVLTLLPFIQLQAQEKIEYQLCDQDFRPISMHDSLPAHAVYANVKASPEARAHDVIKRLSFDEKLMLTGGWNKMHFPAIPKLGIPPVYFADASQGVHIKDICVKVEKSTAFPDLMALAATWNTGLAYNYAQSISEECQAWGINVLLGPGLNMYRNAEGGRNYEYFGEDPLLTSKMAVNYVKGMQSLGTIATIKHFLGNEQEFARHIVDVKINERALHEIYLPPFKAAIKEGGALAVMTGNNFVNGYPGAANTPLSGDVLRREYGFKGIIMSDWASSQFWLDKQGLELTSGHSLLMDNNEIFAKYVRDEIAVHPEKKAIIEKELEEMIFNNLYAFFKSGVYDRPYRNPGLIKNIESHKKIALQTAEEAITLLKNADQILPLQPSKVNKILVLGADEALTTYTGKGSGMVAGYDHVDYLSGLKKVYGNKIIRKPAVSDDEIKAADVILYFINKPAGEGFDVKYEIPDPEQNINRVANLNKNIVVIYSGGNGLPMPWLPNVKGLVFAYLLGQERGNALANIISGKVNPSGKLPITIEKSFDDSPAKDYNKMSDGKYYRQGGKGDSKKIRDQFGTVSINYKEGIYIGYRWFEKMNIEPQFPFGFGLSYTTFNYAGIKSSASVIGKDKGVTVTFNLKNSGKIAGAETAQLYVHEIKNTIDRPVKELKGFQKVYLKSGETRSVNIAVKPSDLAWWNDKTHQWEVNHGDYLLEVGSSSADIKQQIKISY
jgi:beta-glucosidase